MGLLACFRHEPLPCKITMVIGYEYSPVRFLFMLSKIRTEYVMRILLLTFLVACGVLSSGATGRWADPAELSQPGQSLHVLEKALRDADVGQKLSLYWKIYKKIDVKDKSRMKKYLGEMISLAREQGDLEHEGKGYFGQGVVNQTHGAYIEAVSNYEDALVALRQACHKQLLGIIHYNIGNIYMEVEGYDKADEYFHRSLGYFTEVDNLPRVAKVNWCLGLNSLRMGDYDKALRYTRKAIPVYEAIGNDGETAIAYILMGAIYFKMRSYERARRYYRLVGRGMSAIIYNNIGETYLEEGHLDLAEEALEKSLLAKKEQGANAESLAKTWLNLGKLYQKKDQHAKAIGYFEKIMATVSPNQYSKEVKEALELSTNSYDLLIESGLGVDPGKVNKNGRMLAKQLELGFALREKLSANSLQIAHTTKIEENTSKKAYKASVYRMQWIAMASVAGILLAFTFFLASRRLARIKRPRARRA